METTGAPAANPCCEQQRDAESTGGLVLGMEACLYALTLMAGFLLRLAALGSQPLVSEEGSRALSAWQLLQGGTPQVWTEPLVALLTTGAFLLFGDNDFIARIVPTLMGTALIGLMWPLRGMMGRGGALTAAFLIAFSPSFIFYSRFLSGDICAATLALLLVVLVNDWMQSRSRRTLLGASGVLALLLGCGGAAVWYLLIFGAYVAVALALGWWERDLRAAIQATPRQTLLQAVLLCLGVFSLVGVGLFLHPTGLGLPALTEWIGQFRIASAGLPWYYHLLTLVAYEPMVTVFGILGAVYLLRRRGGETDFCRFLVFWAVLGLVWVSLTGQKSSAQSLVVVLPLCLLSGTFLSQLRPTLEKGVLRQASYLLVPAIILLVFTVIATSFLSNTPRLPSTLWVVSALSLAAVLALIVTAAWQWKGQGAHLALLVVLGLSFLFTVHTISNLNYCNSTGEWFMPAKTSPDAIELVRDLDLGTDGKVRNVAVDSRLEPVLGWYLREKESTYYVEKLLFGEATIIALGDRAPEGNMQGYIKQGRWLKSRWFPESLSPAGIWRWLMYREVHGQVQRETIAVYQRK
ncbi:MAG: flippase activity-associated protein Agl23 [Chloroflexota bacterium]